MLTDREGHEVIRLLDLPVHQEALWPEFFRFLPQVGVHVYGPKVGDDVSVRRYTVARQLHVAAQIMWVEYNALVLLIFIKPASAVARIPINKLSHHASLDGREE